MKRLIYYIFACFLCVSCIEEFNELPSGAGEPMLVVEGEIISGRTCFFNLRQTATLESISKGDYADCFQPVTGYLRLDCSDGSYSIGNSYYGIPGYYYINVPYLDPNMTYVFHVLTDKLGDYHTEPMSPLYAPEIEDFYIDMPNDDGQVHFNIATSDPNQPMFLMWDYDEYYEVLTPLHCMWDYDPTDGGFYYRDYRIDQGWISVTDNQEVYCSNADYDNHAIKGYTLYQFDHNALRFRTKYMAIVKQTAISAEEYEYRRLLRLQSTNVGGIFATMPSELPSNLKTKEGKKAIGYVGLRGSIAEARLVVNPNDVHFVDWVPIVRADDDDLSTNDVMYAQGWRPYSFNPIMGPLWAQRYCVDCRAYFWDGGASLEKPYVWPF